MFSGARNIAFLKHNLENSNDVVEIAFEVLNETDRI